MRDASGTGDLIDFVQRVRNFRLKPGKSALGQAPGFVGDNRFRIEDRYQVTEKWQIISINDSCLSEKGFIKHIGIIQYY